MKRLVYVEVVRDTAGGRLLRLNNAEWRHGVTMRMKMIAAGMGLDSIVQYVSVELKLYSQNKAHIKDHHSHRHLDCLDDLCHPEIQDAPASVERERT